MIIHNEELPRNLWKLGRVQKLSARTAEVKMVPGGTVTQRALRHLYPLEIEETDGNETNDQVIVDQEHEDHSSINDNTDGPMEPNNDGERVQEPVLRRSKRTPKLRFPFTNLLIVSFLYLFAEANCIPIKANIRPTFSQQYSFTTCSPVFQLSYSSYVNSYFTNVLTQFQEMFDTIFLITCLLLLILIMGGCAWRKKRPKRYTRMRDETSAVAEESFSVTASTSAPVHHPVAPSENYFHFDDSSTTSDAELNELLAQFCEEAGLQSIPQPSTSGARLAAEPWSKPVYGPCRICLSKQHRTYNCTLPVVERKELLHSQFRCLKCFGKNHSDPRECWAGNCARCRRPHHLFLCRLANQTQIPLLHLRTTSAPPLGVPKSTTTDLLKAKTEFFPGPGRKALSALILILIIAGVKGIPTERDRPTGVGTVGGGIALLLTIIGFVGFNHWAELEDVSSEEGSESEEDWESASTEEEVEVEEINPEDEEDADQSDDADQSKSDEKEEAVGTPCGPNCCQHTTLFFSLTDPSRIPEMQFFNVMRHMTSLDGPKWPFGI